MSNSSWLTSLRANIQPSKNEPLKKTLFIGVGQESNGDDAVGLVIISEIIKWGVESTLFWFLDAGATPENHTHRIRKIQPELVIFIDAAQMDKKPGDIRLMNLNEIAGLSATTHSLPFSTLGQYLKTEIGCDVLILGIQPERNQPNTLLSEKLQVVSAQFVDYLTNLLCCME